MNLSQNEPMPHSILFDIKEKKSSLTHPGRLPVRYVYALHQNEPFSMNHIIIFHYVFSRSRCVQFATEIFFCITSL